MSTPEQRMAMARAIINFEARRDKKGRLQVYKLPAGDGGGRYEVAGINEKYNKEVCDHLVALIEAGQYDKAEALATEFVASDTDVVVTWSRSAAIESYLRDSTFNRGHTGGAKILQMAVGVTPDGVVGPTTRAVVALAEQNPGQLLLDLRAARERYERIKRNEKSPFWKGLVNRWNAALKVAKTFLPAGAAGRGLAAPEISATSFSIETAFSPISDVQTSTAVLSLPLPALRLGMRGPMVKAWEMFLSGEGFDPGEADGVFDDKTDLATRAFQSKFNIEVDGIAGRQSLRKAMDRGFELIEEPAADNTGSNFPPKPASRRSSPTLSGRQCSAPMTSWRLRCPATRSTSASSERGSATTSSTCQYPNSRRRLWRGRPRPCSSISSAPRSCRGCGRIGSTPASSTGF
jgi:peptidoglycan hydrolase-like protein with peptidoglycan-binding domain